MYLSLEDNERRLQRRTKSIIGESYFQGSGVHYAFAGDVPKLDETLISWLENQLDQHPEVRLIVIDPLGFVMGRIPPNMSPYQAEVDAIRKFKILAEERDVSMIIATHTRKTKGEGRLDKVGGTHGLTGTFDTIVMLEPENCDSQKRDQDEGEGEMRDRRARMQIISRDAEADIDIMVLFNGDTCIWQKIGSYHRHRAAAEKKTIADLIMDYMKSGDASPRLQKIAEAVGRSTESVRGTLRRMLKEGLVESNQWGEWGLPKRTMQ